MTRRAAWVFLLLSSLTLAAQNGPRADQSIVVLRGSVTGKGCPIGMHASQGVWDHTVRVREGQKERTLLPFGQRILLSLKDVGPTPIVSARVKVRGLTGKNRMVQTGSVSSESGGGGIKLMTIDFVNGQDGDALGDLYVPGFTSVSSVELLEVSYSDGKVWRVEDAGVCRVHPDGMMLIANQ